MLLRSLSKIMRAMIAGSEAREADIRRPLVESLYASPKSLAIGALSGLLLSIAIAQISHDPVMTGCAVIISLIAMARTISATIYFRKLKTGVAKAYRTWELAYELGAWGYAGMLGLDITRFKDELSHKLYAARVARDIRLGQQSGVIGTPTFFINGSRHTDENSLERLVLSVSHRRLV